MHSFLPHHDSMNRMIVVRNAIIAFYCLSFSALVELSGKVLIKADISTTTTASLSHRSFYIIACFLPPHEPSSEPSAQSFELSQTHAIGIHCSPLWQRNSLLGQWEFTTKNSCQAEIFNNVKKERKNCDGEVFKFKF